MTTMLRHRASMPLQSAVTWLQKADLARESAEKMNSDAAKAAMLDIAQLYEHLAEQTRRLERLGIAAEK